MKAILTLCTIACPVLTAAQAPPLLSVQGTAPPAIAPKPYGKGPYRIAGLLLDATDGHALPHAAIVLYDSDSGSRVADTQADDAGVFAVPNLPAGKFRVEGSARGYITASFDEHEGFSTAIVTGSGLPTESLVLKLEPAARMNGRVTDEAGDPVRNATVSLFHEDTDSGTHKITTFRTARTDDLGQYELTRLPGGTYYATVRGVPWYATHPPQDDNQPNGLGIAPSVDPSLDVIYPLVFYPEATDASGASPIRLKPGERFTADFRLTPQPALRLLFHMPETQNGEPRPNIPQLQQKVFDSFEQVNMEGLNIQGSTVVLSGLSAGRYLLRQVGQNGVGSARNVDLTGGSTTVEAGSLPNYGTVTLQLAKLPGEQPKGRGRPAQDLQLMLHRVDPDAPDDMMPDPWGPVKDGAVELKNVEPGDYRIETPDGSSHVDSITENGKTRPGALLHVTGEGQTARITLGSGSVAMTGFARAAGQGEAGTMVVLVPAGGDHSVDLYRRDQSDQDGSFRFANVMPGNYLLIAIRDGWGLEWGKPGALAPYLPKAVPVSVPAGGHGTIKLSEDVTVQPR